MQLKCSKSNSCSNEKIEYDKSAINNKVSDARAVVGVRLLKSNQIIRENKNRHSGGIYTKLFF